jgi:hypothetical protein
MDVGRASKNYGQNNAPDTYYVGQYMYGTDATTYKITKVGRKYLTVKYDAGPEYSWHELRVVKESMMFEFTGYGSLNPTVLYTSLVERDAAVVFIKKSQVLRDLIRNLPYRDSRDSAEWQLVTESELDSCISVLSKVAQVDERLSKKIEDLYR